MQQRGLRVHLPAAYTQTKKHAHVTAGCKFCKTSLCSASYVGCQRDTARVCCSAPAPATRRTCCTALSIDISCSQGAQQQTHCTPCCCRWTGQTDGRTDAGPFHRLCCAYYLGSVNKHQSCYSLETQTDTHIRSFDLPAPQK